MRIDKDVDVSVYRAPVLTGGVSGEKKSGGEGTVRDSALLNSGVDTETAKVQDDARKHAELTRTVKAGETGNAEKTPEGAKPPAGPVNPELISQLEGYVQKILTDPEAEAKAIAMIAQLNASGELPQVLHSIAETAVQSGNFPPIPEEKRIEMVNQLAGMIDAELRAHGMTPETHGQVYTTWEAMSKEHISLVENSKIPPRGPGELSAFTEPAFIKELETLQGAPFLPGNRVTPLFDGPASFAVRDRMIEGAEKSIHLMTWAFYDDETGWDTARKLAAKHHEGIDVKVVVDGQIGSKMKHNKPLEFMEKEGIKVVRWRNPDELYQGQHRKVMIVDGKEAIAGGINQGDVYSHRGPEGTPKWRDTDILIEGPAVAECERLFSKVSGEEAKVSASSEPVRDSGGKVAIVDHTPKEDAHILLATMKAIQGASESIDIENAYFIQTPGIRHVLMNALDRGVKVRLLTNSAESIDEPVITAPILKSLPDLINAGAEVYLKKGDTLHSKFMVVDGIFSSTGSYNLHPRSERYEGEMMIHSLDTEAAGVLKSAFEKDIAEAVRIEKAEQVAVPDNLLTILAERYFFDQL